MVSEVDCPGIKRTLGVMRQNHDARQARKERDRRADLVLERAVLRLRVVGVEHQHRTLQQIHDVVRRRAHDLGCGEAVGQAALRIEGFHEHIELAFRGQLAHQQQVGDFLEPTALGCVAADKIVDAVAAEGKLAFVGHLIALVHQIAVNVGDVGDACDNARAIAVAQTALHGIALVQFGVNGVDLRNVVVQGKLMVFHGCSFHLRDLIVHPTCTPKCAFWRTITNWKQTDSVMQQNYFV